jgi:hypothetical protein
MHIILLLLYSIKNSLIGGNIICYSICFVQSIKPSFYPLWHHTIGIVQCSLTLCKNRINNSCVLFILNCLFEVVENIGMELEKFNNKMMNCKEARYIALSSCFFLVPIYRGFSCGVYGYTIPLFLSWFFSVNYWRNPCYSWRRDVDILCSQISCTMFSCLFIFVVKNPLYYMNIAGAYYLFCISNKKFEEGYPYWWKYHILFHLVCSWNTFIILNYVCLSKNGEHGSV